MRCGDGVFIGAGIAIGNADGVESTFEAEAGAVVVFAAEVCDLPVGDHAVHGAHHEFGVGGVFGEIFGGDGFDGLVDGVDLDAVLGKGFGDGVEEVAEAVIVPHDEEVEAPVFCIFEHLVKLGDAAFCV